jgi:hypothetical protein
MISGKLGKKILISWLGITDLKASGQIPSRTDEIVGEGPILGALNNLTFDELHLLHDQENSKTDAYIDWLSEHVNIKMRGLAKIAFFELNKSEN